VLFAACLCAGAQTGAEWSLARTAHFEVYSQAGGETARSTALWLEQLRALFVGQTGLKLEDAVPVRAIAFRSVNEYQPYRLRVASDAYYVSAEGRDYIVMPAAGAEEFRVAAHEYAHSLLHSSGLRLPAWLSEGLAEFFSTARIGERGSRIGGDLPARSQTLRQMPWLPLDQLLGAAGEPSPRDDRERTSVFYAQSWALTDMLMFSEEYGPKFARLVAALSTGEASVPALVSLYARPLDIIARYLHAWTTGRRPRVIPLAAMPAAAVRVEVSPVSEFASRLLMADLLAAIGEWGRAEALYRDLAREDPSNALAPAALGTIALKRGDPEAARREWKRAIDLGVNDAALCYRYATLASLAGLPEPEVRRAYLRAIELKPDFDDARYALGLMEKNAGENEAALEQWRAMRNVEPARQFHYWFAIADALVQLGRREEALSAAKKAAEHAESPEQRVSASRLASLAKTDLGVRFARDADGRNRLETTRVPHGADDFNPFIEPGDDVRKIQGKLREIDCSGPVTRFLVETASGTVTLAIPDPTHLQARKAPPEFTCGAQPGASVGVVYAAGGAESSRSDGILRGIEFQ